MSRLSPVRLAGRRSLVVTVLVGQLAFGLPALADVASESVRSDTGREAARRAPRSAEPAPHEPSVARGNFAEWPTPEASSDPARRRQVRGDGADAVVSDGGRFRVRFGRRSPAAVTARLGRGAKVGFHFEGGVARRAQEDGETVRFRGVADGVDVEYAIVEAGLKEVVVVHRRLAPDEAVFRFPLRLEGLSARNDPDGSVGLYDAADKKVGWFPDGVVTDSAPVPAVAAVDVRLVAGDVLEVRPDPAFMSSPSTVLPLRVDPTLMSGNNPPPAPGNLRPVTPAGATSATVTTTTPTLGADPVVDGDGPQPCSTCSGCRTPTILTSVRC